MLQGGNPRDNTSPQDFLLREEHRTTVDTWSTQHLEGEPASLRASCRWPCSGRNRVIVPGDITGREQ